MFFQPQNEKQITEVCLKTECFKVELAITDQEKAQGLMFRTSLPEKSGMLFIYKKESQPGIWMKNTKIPLDIIWLNQNKEIVFLAKNAPPGDEKDYAHFSPGISASYVLEINAGWADKLNLQTGDKISFNLE
ncbi:MAG: DUF192 domain-containing protein [bacterium]